jgi:Tfp pilus assembly protein FimT
VGKGRIRTLKGDHPTGGFTLLEISVVILLLGFLFLFSVPRFQALMEPRDIRRAVRGLVGTVRYIQSQAATTKQRYRLQLDLKENLYWVSIEGGLGTFLRESTPSGRSQSLPRGVQFMDFIHPDRGKIQEGVVSVEFSPTGWAEECTIHMKKSEQEVFTIFVHSLGGRVEVAPGYLEKVRG